MVGLEKEKSLREMMVRLGVRELESFLKSKSVSRRYAGRNAEGLAGQN